MKFYLFTALLIASLASYGQYWFGPKIGYSYITHNYQDSEYKNTYDVPADWNFQAGAALSYTATSRYSVYGELLYERIEKKVENIAITGITERSEMTNHYISVPIMLRITLGRVPFHYYINGGPRLAYWLGGKGTLLTEELLEFPDNIDAEGNPLPNTYRIRFNLDKVTNDASSESAFVSKPNRVQFGLTVGGGMFFDMQGGGRLQCDFRYTWVHSNMATNNGDADLNFISGDYRENFEFYNNIATVGVAYLFPYNSQFRRKGKSTSKQSKKKK